MWRREATGLGRHRTGDYLLGARCSYYEGYIPQRLPALSQCVRVACARIARRTMSITFALEDHAMTAADYATLGALLALLAVSVWFILSGRKA
jgi:hypothetical protein